MTSSIIGPLQIAHLLKQQKVATKGIPDSLLATLAYLPENHQATLIMRHGERPDLPISGADNVLLTAEGKEVAKKLGTFLVNKQPGLLVSSPKERCVETLTAIVEGAGWQGASIEKDQLVAPSSPFIANLEEAIRSFEELGGPTLFNRQITDSIPPPGMGSTAEGVKKVLDAYVQYEKQNPALINIVVTHDAVLTVLIGYLIKLTFSEADWPEFLNGVLIWKDAQELNVVWRGNQKKISL